MKKKPKREIESIMYLGGVPEKVIVDTKCAMFDVFVQLKNDPENVLYFLEIATPNSFIFDMERENKNFINPAYPCVIVREMTEDIIRQTLEEYLENDAFWLKFYSEAGQYLFRHLRQ